MREASVGLDIGRLREDVGFRKDVEGAIGFGCGRRVEGVPCYVVLAGDIGTEEEGQAPAFDIFA